MWFSIFPCFQCQCTENCARQVSASAFFVQVGNISNSIRVFFSTKFMTRLRAKINSIAAEANHLSFWYIDLQISTFSQIPFGIFFFLKSLIPNWSGVILWQIRKKTLEALGANSHFPLPCPSLLGSKWSTLLSVQLCPVELTDQI